MRTRARRIEFAAFRQQYPRPCLGAIAVVIFPPHEAQ
jgi:hypothetical protein